MKIAFDVDGVLTNLEKYQLEYGKKYFKNKLPEEIHMDEIDIKEIFSCTKSEREKFWLLYIWKYCFLPFKEEMSALIRQLKDEGDEIYIVTGRAHTTEKGITGALFRRMLFHMLKKERIPYDHIFFCSEDNSAEEKYNICKEQIIDLIVEDKKENIDELKNIMKVICVDATYNRMYSHPEVPRVKNANEIYNEIQKVKNKKYFTKLSRDEVASLTSQEKIIYYSKLREYYFNLPYDELKYQKTESNYTRLSKTAVPIFNALFNPTVFNRDLLPDENGLLFVANHNNYYDQFPIIAAIGDHRPIHFLTATKMLNMKRGNIYLKTGAVSIDREDKNDREFAKDEVTKILTHDSNVFIFPEGRTNRGEEFLLDFHPGAAAIAQACGCKIVPVAVSALYNKKTGEPCVRFGKPFKIDPNDDVLEATQMIKETIGKLKTENNQYIENQKIKKIGSKSRI